MTQIPKPYGSSTICEISFHLKRINVISSITSFQMLYVEFEDDLNNITMNQQKILTSLKKPNWIDKLQLSTDNNKTSQQQQQHKRNKTTLTPLRNNGIMNQHNTSRNVTTLDFESPMKSLRLPLNNSNNTMSENIANNSMMTMGDKSPSYMLNQTVDYQQNYQTLIPGNHPLLPQLNAQLSNAYFSSKKYSVQQNTIKPIVVGSNLDQIFLSKEQSLFTLRQQNEDLKLENDQFKSLNTRLIERVDYLQNIIDKEANASEFYFNYPPKPDQQLTNDIKSLRDKSDNKTSKNTNNSNPTVQEQKSEEQISKIRKLYEDKIERDKRINERAYNVMQRSFTLEIDELQSILSQSIQAHVALNKEHNNQVERFNKYYQECDRYIKEREQKVQGLQGINQQLQEELDKYTNLYQREKYEHDALKKTYTTYQEQYIIMKSENVNLRKEVLMYEEKYKFIDIGKMHEKVQYLTTQLDQSEKKRKILQQELFDLRDKILRATAQRFQTQNDSTPQHINGKPQIPSGQITPGQMDDQQQQNNNGGGNVANNQNGGWKGEEEIEQTAQALLEFIHNEISATFPKGNQLNQWTNKLSKADNSI